MPLPRAISIELEIEGDPRSLFRIKIDDTVVAKNMTAAQAHLLVGDILERIALPNKRRKTVAKQPDGSP